MSDYSIMGNDVPLLVKIMSNRFFSKVEIAFSLLQLVSNL